MPRSVKSAALVACVCVAGLSHGQDTTRWIGPNNGAFGNPANWDNGVPGVLDTAVFEPPASGVVRLFESTEIRELIVRGNYSFNLLGSNLTVSRSVDVAPESPGASASAQFSSGLLRTRRVAANNRFGDATLRFTPSVLVEFIGQLDLPPGENASILSGVNPLLDPNASRLVRFEGPFQDARSLFVRPLGRVELAGSFTTNPGDANFDGPVIIASRGTLATGRRINADAIDNYGDLIIDTLIDNVPTPTNVQLSAPFRQDARQSQFPELSGRSGVVEIDLFDDQLEATDTLEVNNFASLSGGLRLRAAFPINLQSSIAPTPIAFFEALDPAASRFDVITVPVTGAKGYFRPVQANNSVFLEAEGFQTPIEFSPEQPLGVGGFAADAVSDDFDGDGVPDVASALPFDSGPNGAITVVFSQLNPNNQFTGFSSPSVFNTCENEPDLIESFDADADGDNDLAYYNRGNGVLVVRLNDGSGNFDDLSFKITELPAGVVDLVSGQFEERFTDGGLNPEDLAVVINNGPGNPGTVRFLISNGSDFEFCDVDTGPEPSSGDPIDIDGDQAGAYQPAVAVTVDGNDTVEIIPNPSEGGLGAEPNIVIPVDEGPSDVAAGDLDDDGFPDLTVASSDAGTVTVLKSVPSLSGTSDRTFTSAVSLPASDAADPSPKSIKIADADEDGDADVFIVANKAESNRLGPNALGFPATEVRFFRNVRDDQKAIVLQESQSLPRQSSDFANLLVFADFDIDRQANDPGDDLVVLTIGAADDGLTRLSQDEPVAPVCTADVNGDGDLNGLDFGAWLAAFNAGLPTADQNGDGQINGLDFGAWLANYNAGC